MRKVDPKRYQARRRKILDAAVPLFATRGYDGTTTAEICRAAGISSGNLFHYFSSKREIFAAIYEDNDGEKARRMEAALSSSDPLSALFDVVDLLTEAARSALAPQLVLEAMLRAYRDTELAEMLSRDDENEQEVVETLIRRAIDAGQIDRSLDPEDTAGWIMILIGSVYIRAATNPEFSPDEQLPMLRIILERFLQVEGN